jgi:hypothetical protein
MSGRASTPHVSSTTRTRLRRPPAPKPLIVPAAQDWADLPKPGCRGGLSFADQNLGLNNQLASIAYVLCMANLTNVCSIHAAPLGYVPCGEHMAGTRQRFGRHSCTDSGKATALEIPELLRLPDGVTGMLRRGKKLAAAGQAGPCAKGETKCKVCGAYSQNPWRCAQAGIEKGMRVQILYAYGLRYHLGKLQPRCPPMKLQLTPAIEDYARALMARLQLEPGRFVAAQYRTGWSWRVHTQEHKMEWACYGPRTINATLANLKPPPPAGMPLFLLTNAYSIHTPSVPVPVQVMSEMLVTSLAHTVMLNPLSSFQHAVLQLRGSGVNVHFVSREDVIAGDTCECTAADERPVAARHAQIRQVCDNSSRLASLS